MHFKTAKRLGVVVYVSPPSSWQVETGGSGVQSQPRLHSQLGLYAIWSYCVAGEDPPTYTCTCSPGLQANWPSSLPSAVGSLLSSMHGSTSSSCKGTHRDTHPVQRSVSLGRAGLVHPGAAMGTGDEKSSLQKLPHSSELIFK